MEITQCADTNAPINARDLNGQYTRMLSGHLLCVGKRNSRTIAETCCYCGDEFSTDCKTNETVRTGNHYDKFAETMRPSDIFTQVLGAGFDPFTQLDQLPLSKQVELARALGDARFASDCAHEQVKNGHCVVCLRKVI